MLIGVTGRPGPADQRWKLSSVGISVLDRDQFLGLHAGQNTWRVTTPLISDQLTNSPLTQ